MEPLFRLLLARPAIGQDPDFPNILLVQESSVQTALAQAATAATPREAIRRTAQSFVAGPDFVGTPADMPLSSALSAFAVALDHLERQAAISNSDLVSAIQQAFNAGPGTLLQSQEMNTALRRLRDSIILIKLLPEEHHRPIDALVNRLRDLEIISKAAEDNSFPATPDSLRRYRRRALLLPSELNLPSILSRLKVTKERQQQAAEAAAERQEQANHLFQVYQQVKKAIGELTNLDSSHLQTSQQEKHKGFIPPKERSPIGVITRRGQYFDKLSDLNLEQINTAIHRENGNDPLVMQDRVGAYSAAKIAEKVLDDHVDVLKGSPTFLPLSLSEVSFRLSATAEPVLSQVTHSILQERNLVITERPLDRIVEALQTELDNLRKQLDVLYYQPDRRSVRRMGETLVTISTPVVTTWSSVVLGTLPPPVPLLTIEESIPHTHRRVEPAGVADLLIIKQQLIGYEGADIAHIENILRGEKKLREHTRSQETEEITFRESEITTSEERELQSTDRFEMSRETNITLKEDASLKAGLTLSGKYGPTVDFSANAEGAANRSKEEATKAATSYSKEVTERSANRISERVLERTSLRITRAVTEKNTHELNNMMGQVNVSGVYQWLNKVYQAQMFNYGIRMMFDFMIPEPASFLIEILRSVHASSVQIEKPLSFTLTPKQITEENYAGYVLAYGATDVTPPPEIYKTKSLDFNAGGGEEETDYNHSAQITIEEGYKAIEGTVGVVLNLWEDAYTVDVILGRKAHRFALGKPWVWITALDNQVDTIPFALNTNWVSDIAVAVEVKCQRTERAMEKWRHETHAKLSAAYRGRLAEYEEKLTALQLQAGIPVQGKNPALNLEFMKDELKKNCVSMLTEQHYDLFNAIVHSWNTGLPEISIEEAEAEGTYVRFFEQAFEWEYMTWVTYPYFWGRKEQWDERLSFDDPDPVFNQFLKAGFCRVSVPVRPSFEGALDHFMNHGEVWNGGPLPPISNPLYLSISDEIAERLKRPGEELPQGDPWLVRIPTSLVRLRPDDTLPAWVQDANGNWIEAN